jgi:hypothetical protein
MKLKLGTPYTRIELGELLNENIAGTREGVYYCKGGLSGSTIFFVTLNKKGRKEHLQFNDYFEDFLFHWDSQPKQSIKVPTIKSITSGKSKVYLFVRVEDKTNNKTNPYLYCGSLSYLDYDSTTSKPVHLIFQSDYFNYESASKGLREIYDWKPDANLTRKINKEVSNRIKEAKKARTFSKPNETSKYRFVNTRLGQDWYRSKLLEIWGNKCAVTGFSNPKILIASHIKPWSECTIDEQLDEFNGILLSPSLDALFDKHLISFNDVGDIIISNLMPIDELTKLGINQNMKLNKVPEEILLYLRYHRSRLI